MITVRISDLAQRTGTSPPTIRYYEQIGLLRPAVRQAGGQRVYGREDIINSRSSGDAASLGSPSSK